MDSQICCFINLFMYVHNLLLHDGISLILKSRTMGFVFCLPLQISIHFVYGDAILQSFT